MSTLRRKEYQIRVNRCGTTPDRYVLFGARVHPHFVPAAVLPLQESNNAVVFELLADRPHQNRTHLSASKPLDNQGDQTRKSSMILPGYASWKT
jgi:hypothetical protein